MSIQRDPVTYLNQWLKVASGDRVHLAARGQFGLSDFLVFKCNFCQDNWHVGAGNFNGTNVPQVLTDWVKKHRHVCDKYTNTHGLTQGTCSMCGWPYGAHEASWNTEGTPPAAVYPMIQNIPAAKIEKPLPTFKGRKFRDDSDEGI